MTVLLIKLRLVNRWFVVKDDFNEAEIIKIYFNDFDRSNNELKDEEVRFLDFLKSKGYEEVKGLTRALTCIKTKAELLVDLKEQEELLNDDLEIDAAYEITGNIDSIEKELKRFETI